MTEYVCGTCVDLSPGDLYACRSLAEVESLKPLKCRVRVYKRDFERFLAANILTDTVKIEQSRFCSHRLDISVV